MSIYLYGIGRWPNSFEDCAIQISIDILHNNIFQKMQKVSNVVGFPQIRLFMNERTATSNSNVR